MQKISSYCRSLPKFKQGRLSALALILTTLLRIQTELRATSCGTHIFTYFILNNLPGWEHYYLQFSEEGTGAQRGEVTCPQSHSSERLGLEATTPRIRKKRREGQKRCLDLRARSAEADIQEFSSRLSLVSRIKNKTKKKEF